MSLHPQPIGAIPEETARVARAAFPKGSPYLTLRDQLGTLYDDGDFPALFPASGQPGLPPWRLALVTLMQFMASLPIKMVLRWTLNLKYIVYIPEFFFNI